MTTSENIDSVHDMILRDRQIGFKRIAEALHIFYEPVFHIAHYYLDVQKLSAEWILKGLHSDQRRFRETISRKICSHFKDDSSN